MNGVEEAGSPSRTGRTVVAFAVSEAAALVESLSAGTSVPGKVLVVSPVADGLLTTDRRFPKPPDFIYRTLSSVKTSSSFPCPPRKTPFVRLSRDFVLMRKTFRARDEGIETGAEPNRPEPE